MRAYSTWTAAASSLAAWAAIASAVSLAACGAEPPPAAATAPVAKTAPPPARPAAPPADPLGPKPEVLPPPPFSPPTPAVFQIAGGMTVWHLERHALPLVALALAVPSGSSADPPGSEGLAFATAGMLDEGAGSLGAIELAQAVDMLGASLTTGATQDMSFAELFVLKRNLAQGLPLLADVVARPRFDDREWRRVHDLWSNDLKARTKDPQAVSGVVTLASLFGAGTPYGHPVSGTIASAKKIDLATVKRFYASAWRPERSVVVAVGDVTRSELTTLLEGAFGGWKPAAPPMTAAAAPARAAAKAPPRIVVVDRPDAPQSVIALIRPGVPAGDKDVPALVRANIALGGSFTSRLNQDLREEHGWSYGASSRVMAARSAGAVIASAAVFTDKTGDALKAMLADVDAFAKKGLSDEESFKTQVQARSDVVEDYERVERTALLLAKDAALGLPADHEAKASALRDAATKADLDRIAATYMDPKDAVIVVVGPHAKLAPQLDALGLTKAELRDAEGNAIAAAKKK